MKPRQKSTLSFSARPSNWLGLCTLTLSLLTAGSVLAQTSTWDGGGVGSNWNTGDNWSSNTVPTGGILNFFGTTQTAAVNNLTAATAFTGITFTNNGTAGQDSAFSLSGNSIALGGNITTTTPATGPPAGVTMLATISLDLNLSSNSTFTASRNGTTLTGHNLTVSGLISETGGPFSLTKAGNANLTLSNTGNSFSGAFNITGNNDVTVGSIQPAGTNSSIGKGSVINMSTSNGFLIVNGNVATAGDINRTINLTNTGTATYRFQNDNGTATNSLAFVSAITNSSTSGTTTFTLAGSNTGANEFRTAIVNGSGTNTTVLSKINGGRWILSGDNTYKGATTVTAGFLNLRHNNALGTTDAGTTVSNGAQLEIEGAGLSFAAEALTLTSGSSGSIAMLRNVSGNNTWNGTITATTNATVGTLARIQSDAGTLTLAGGMSGAGVENSFVLQGAGNIDVTGVISGAIRVNSGTNGAGVRSLSNANTYSGITTVGGGVLRLNHVTAVPGGIDPTGGTSNINLAGAGAILGLGANNLTRALGTGVDQIQMTANSVGFAAYGADRSVNFGGASAALTWGSGGFMPSGSNFVLGHATATHTLDFQNPVILNSTRFFMVNDGGATVDARLSGAITGSTTFSKGGSGTLELTNTGNAWTNTTFIDSGTLRLGASNVLPGNTVELKRSNNNTGLTNPSLDLAGSSDTIGGITLGHTTSDATNSGGEASIIDSGTTKGILTLGGNIDVKAGSAGFLNGQSTISANLATGNSARSIIVGDGSATDDLTISGAISGSGTLTKQELGTLLLSGANTHSGRLDVQAGTAKLGANNVLPDGNGLRVGVAASTTNAVFDINGRTETVGALDINGELNFVGVTPGGTSHSIIDNATTKGVLTLGGAFAVQASSNAFKNGTALISANINTGNAQRNFTINDSTGSADVDLRISGLIVGINGFNKASTGTLALSGSNTFSGVSTLSTGIILVENSLAFQNSPVATGTAGTGQITLGSGITALTVGGLRTTDRDLSDVITNYSSLTALTINPGAASASTFTKVIGDNSASMTITKTGGGAQTFAGDNTYKGATAVNEGSLVINGNQSGATGAVSVSNAGTRLMGLGTIGGATTINAGAIYTPGNATGAVGGQTLSSSLTFGSGSIFEWDISSNNTSTGFDTVAATGNIDVGTSTVFKVVFGTGVDLSNAFWSTPSTPQAWSMTSIFGKAFNSGSFSSVTSTADPITQGSFSITDSTLTWTAVPEPSSALVGLLVGAGLLRRRRA